MGRLHIQNLFSKKSKEAPKRRNRMMKFSPKPKKSKNLSREIISPKNISLGQVILGCIEYIKIYEIILQLPDGIKAHLPITNISTAYTRLLTKYAENSQLCENLYNLDELYTPGQLLVVKVKEISPLSNGKVKVTVSSLPEDTNSNLFYHQINIGTVLQGAVVGIEDKGYIINLSHRNIRAAFMEKAKAPPGVVGIGSIFLCTIQTVSERDSALQTVCVEVAVLSESSSSISNSGILVPIFPGALVSGVVREVLSNGLMLKINNNHHGYVNSKHLLDWEETTTCYKPNQLVKVRILYEMTLSKVAFCSLNANLCKGGGFIKIPSDEVKVGEYIENAEIFKSLEQCHYLRLPNGYHGFCPSSFLNNKGQSDGSDVQNVFTVGTLKDCRIIGRMLFNHAYLVSFQEHILSKTVLMRENLFIGQKVTVKILDHQDKGAVVHISDHLKGLIPSIHLTDTQKSFELAYPIGKSFNAKIIRLRDKNHPELTLKHDLVESNLPIITSYDEKNIDIDTLGCIIQIFQNGLLLELYNETEAFVPLSYIPADLGDLPTAFRLGQIVKCHIIEVNPKEKKMICSLDIIMKNLSQSYSLGDRVKCKVINIDHDKITVSITDNFFKACIPKYHLADDVDLAAALFLSIQKGDVIHNAVVFRIQICGLTLSLKPSILQYIESLRGKVKVTDLVTLHEVVPSVVTEVTEDYLEVTVPRGRVGSLFRLYKMFATNKAFIDVPLTTIPIGQTLFIDYVSHKNSQYNCLAKLCGLLNKEISSLQLLYNTIETEKQIQAALEKMERSPFREVKIGKVYSTQVITRTALGVLVYIPSLGLNGVIPAGHFDEDTMPIEKSTLNAIVMCINYKYKCLELTAKMNLTLSAHNNTELEVGEKYKCNVLLAKSEFILARMSKPHEGQVVYLPAKRHMNDFTGRNPYYTIGKMYDIKIRYIKGSLILADLVVHCQESKNPPLLQSQFAKIKFKNALTLSTIVQPLVPNQPHINNCDTAQQIISHVAQPRNPSINETSLQKKWHILKNDNFPQFNLNLMHTHKSKMHKKKNSEVPSKRKVYTSEEYNEIYKEQCTNRLADGYLITKSMSKKLNLNSDILNDILNETKPNEKLKAGCDANGPTKCIKIVASEVKEPYRKRNEDENSPMTNSLHKISKSNSDAPININDKTSSRIAESTGEHNSKSFKCLKKNANKSLQADSSSCLTINRKRKDEHDAKARKFVKIGSKVKEQSTKRSGDENLPMTDSLCKLSNSDSLLNASKASKPTKKRKGKCNLKSHKCSKKGSNESLQVDSSLCLNINSSGFKWDEEPVIDENNVSDEEDASSEDEGIVPGKLMKKLSKFEVDHKRKKEEKKTRALELQRLDPDRAPETALDYEEKIEKAPTSAAIWIEYISFHLENAETEKARAVGDRALKRIPATMETERLAIWNVILRLEVMFGSSESVDQALKEALITNDEVKVYYLMIDIYANAAKIQEGTQVIYQMTKKYSQCLEVWIKAGLFYFKAKELEQARTILNKAIASLPVKEHVDIINRFAQLELKYGDFERGKTIFEKMLSNFPKRLDIWNVYVDMLRKHNDITGARNVLERMTGLKLKLKAMRSVFKKLLEFEKTYGTPQRVETVKLMVEKYVERELKDQ